MLKDNKINTLKSLGRDTAYTFKGLYKTADFWQWLYMILLLFPLSGSVFLLLNENSHWLEKFFGVLGIFFTMLMYIFQKNFEKVNEYRILANKFKDIYDEILAYYNANDVNNIDSINKRLALLRKKTARLNIHPVARKWANWRIKEEMDLSWIEKRG